MRSILKTLRNRMFIFGLAMGVIFPLYAHFFVHWKEGMFPYFAVGAVGAGITVGLVNSLMVKHILVSRLSEISTLSDKLAEGVISERLHLESDDQIGDIAKHLNRFLNENQQTVLAIQTQLQTISKEITQMIAVANMLQEYIDHSGGNSLTGMVTVLQDLSLQNRSVNTTLEEVKEYESQITEEIHFLDKSIVSMKSKLETIDTIAMKSRTLAINSAVEAARFGIQGKVFAIVGEEMEELSQNTTYISHDLIDEMDLLENHFNTVAKSINSIHRAIDDSQERLRDNMKSMDLFTLNLSNISKNIENVSSAILDTVQHFDEMRDQLAGLIAR